MAFDMSFNFRANANFVTDGSEGVPALSENYPHTYTAANGYSINAGGGASAVDRDATNDPRIAGISYIPNSGSYTFQVDLSSGSAPGAGTYQVDCAMGDAAAGHPQYFQVLDTSTVLIDGTNGGSGYTTATDHYVDATLADRAATTTWNGSAATKTFATTLAKITVGGGGLSDVSSLAHFRLTLAGAPPAGLAIPIAMHQYRQRRA